MDEAMHPLTILASGIYGKALPPQDGAPIRLVVPWKYGFKGIKSIVKIRLTAEQPKTTWNEYAPNEYGFYANVNPHKDHPRWSQATEQRIGESGRRPTLMFNGYEEQVGHLYAGYGSAEEISEPENSHERFRHPFCQISGAGKRRGAGVLLGWDALNHQLGARTR